MVGRAGARSLLTQAAPRAHPYVGAWRRCAAARRAPSLSSGGAYGKVPARPAGGARWALVLLAVAAGHPRGACDALRVACCVHAPQVLAMQLNSLQATIYYSSTHQEEEVNLLEMVDKGEVAWPPAGSSAPKPAPQHAPGTPQHQQGGAKAKAPGGAKVRPRSPSDLGRRRSSCGGEGRARWLQDLTRAVACGVCCAVRAAQGGAGQKRAADGDLDPVAQQQELQKKMRMQQQAQQPVRALPLLLLASPRLACCTCRPPAPLPLCASRCGAESGTGRPVCCVRVGARRGMACSSPAGTACSTWRAATGSSRAASSRWRGRRWRRRPSPRSWAARRPAAAAAATTVRAATTAPAHLPGGDARSRGNRTQTVCAVACLVACCAVCRRLPQQAAGATAAAAAGGVQRPVCGAAAAAGGAPGHGRAACGRHDAAAAAGLFSDAADAGGAARERRAAADADGAAAGRAPRGGERPQGWGTASSV